MSFLREGTLMKRHTGFAFDEPTGVDLSLGLAWTH
jgi:hypothetical protein